MSNVYRIGIEIALTGSAAAGLQAISRQLTGVHNQSLAINGIFSKWGAALGGAAAVIGGSALLGGLVKIADHGEKLIHQQNALVRAGMGYNDVLKLTSDAYDRIAKAVPTAAADDILRAVNELRSVTGDVDKATAIAPFSLKLEALLKNLTGADAEGAGFQIWRALEMKGITTSDPAGAQKLATALAQDIAGSGGKLTAETYQSLARRGGAAWIHATPEAVAGPYSVAAADLGGQGAGTALMTMYNLLSGATTISRQQLDVMQKAGIIDMDKVKKIPGSNAMQVAPGAIQDSLNDAGNLFNWVQNVAPKLHALAEKMAADNGQSESTNFDSLIAKLGRNRNAIKMLTMFSDPGFVDQINKDIAVWSRAMPLDQAYATMLGRPGADVTGPGGLRSEAASDAKAGGAAKMADYTAVMAAFQKQWESLMEAVGGPVARGMIPILQSLTNTFTSLGSFANAHPETIALVAQAIGALGVAIAGLGTAAIIGAAAALIPGGAVGAAIVGVGLAITTIAALNWQSVSTVLSSISSALNAFIGSIAGIASKISAALGGLNGAAGAAPTAPAAGRNPRSPSTGPYSYPQKQANAGTPMHIRTALYLDSRVLAEATSSALANLSSFPGQAAQGDTYADWVAPDYNFATG